MPQRSTDVFMKSVASSPDCCSLILISCSPQTPSQAAGLLGKALLNPSNVEVGGGGRCLVGVD